MLRLGFARLSALVAGHVASFGDVNWQTDPRLAEVLRRPDGRQYHPESIGRVRRELARLGYLESERCKPGELLPGDRRFRSAHGTTIKRFRWPAIEARNPFPRRARRLERMRQAQEARERGDVHTGPRHAGVSILEPRVAQPIDDPGLRRAAAELELQLKKLWARDEAAAGACSGQAPAPAPAAPGPRSPPD